MTFVHGDGRAAAPGSPLVLDVEMVRNCAPLGSAFVQAAEDRWVIELGGDDYVILAREDSVWEELDQEERRRIVGRFQKRPVPILSEYRHRTTAATVLAAALQGVEAQVEDLPGNVVAAEQFRHQLKDGHDRLT